MKVYNHQKIEKKWGEVWQKTRLYQPRLQRGSQKSKVKTQKENTGRKPKYYNLMMFPYPSAEGLHVGNMYAFTGSDVWGRYKRMSGYEVFEPIGLDGFGIHSENYAIKIGKHPAEQAKVSEKNFYRQLQLIGNGFAWDNRLETYDSDYYKWTQWLFVKMFKKGLAYRQKSAVNWCPSCKTVLADEQVEAGVCERCKTEVGRKQMEQWFFKITKYADRLLDNLSVIKWPKKIKTAQRNWIGRSQGVEVEFKIKNSKFKIIVFTTAHDTIFGSNFLVLSPEYAQRFIDLVPRSSFRDVRNYIEVSLNKTEQQRKLNDRQKTGVNMGLKAVNPFTEEEIPVFVADYVLMDVGTGAVMGVPGHDARDHEFAKKLGLPIKIVVRPTDRVKEKVNLDEDGFWDYGVDIKQKFARESVLFNSGILNGLNSLDARQKIEEEIEKRKIGRKVTNYHLRDWLISRQRYWGPPIPMVYCEECAKKGRSWGQGDPTTAGRDAHARRAQDDKADLKSVSALSNEKNNMAGWWPVPERELPVKLPMVKDYKPSGDGRSPLEKAGDNWLYTKCPKCGGRAKRETDIIDNFVDSAWYFLRYPSINQKSKIKNQNDRSKIKNSKEELPWDCEITRQWLPVDAYIGGAEHAVLHLLYSRFMWMFLRDYGYLEVKGDDLCHGEEPFPFLFSHGLIIKDGKKMSKSRGNVVVPDDYIAKYGADTLRMYLMFVGFYGQGGDFRDTGIAAIYRFLTRVWALYSPSGGRIGKTSTSAMSQAVNRCVKQVTERIERFKYNTAISALMEVIAKWRNQISKVKMTSQKSKSIISFEDAGKILKLLAPLAPFMTEELWSRLKAEDPRRKASGQEFSAEHSVHLQQWPEWDEKLVTANEVLVVVQVNGKMRSTFQMQKSKIKNQKEMIKLVKEDERVKKWLKGKKVKKEIWVEPSKQRMQGLLNLVID